MCMKQHKSTPAVQAPAVAVAAPEETKNTTVETNDGVKKDKKRGKRLLTVDPNGGNGSGGTGVNL